MKNGATFLSDPLLQCSTGFIKQLILMDIATDLLCYGYRFVNWIGETRWVMVDGFRWDLVRRPGEWTCVSYIPVKLSALMFYCMVLYNYSSRWLSKDTLSIMASYQVCTFNRWGNQLGIVTQGGPGWGDQVGSGWGTRWNLVEGPSGTWLRGPGGIWLGDQVGHG